MFNYMHFTINKTIKQKKEKERKKEIEVFKTRSGLSLRFQVAG